MFKRNVTYKVAAICVAVLIWFYANRGQDTNLTREVRVPLEVRNVDGAFVVTSAPTSVRVELHGGRNHVQSIAADPEAVTAYVSLRNQLTAGRQSLPVIVRVPERLTGLVSASPSPREAAVTLEKRVERALPVSVQFTGSPPVGYRYAQPQVSPVRVVVSGTEDRTRIVDQLVVSVDPELATNDGIKADFRVTALDKFGKTVTGIGLAPEKVHVRLDLLEAPASRAVFVSVDTVGQPPFPHKIVGIDVYPQTVTITGRPEKLVNITTLKTEPINLSNRSKTFTERVEILPRAGIELADGKEVRVTVRIEASEQQEETAEPAGH